MDEEWLDDLANHGDEVEDDKSQDADYTPNSKKIIGKRNAKTSKPAKSSTKKPKVATDWTDEEVFKLIACVELQPPLWNAGDAKYKNRIERNKIWNEMSENEFESKFDAEQLLAKWTNVRIQYRSYAAKKTKSGQEAEAPAINWKFFSSMAFVGRAEVEQTALTESNLVSVYMHFQLNFI